MTVDYTDPSYPPEVDAKLRELLEILQDMKERLQSLENSSQPQLTDEILKDLNDSNA